MRAALGRVKSRTTLPKMSVTRAHESELRCPGCGSILEGGSVLYRSPSKLYEKGGTCPRCYLAADERGDGIVATGRRLEGSEEPEERFGRLFEAARALLQARLREEAIIFPTLKLASEAGARRFRLLYRGVEMVDVVGEVPILRRKAVRAGAVRSPRSASKAVMAVEIVVTASTRAPRADDIARTYEKVLQKEGMAWGGSGGRFSYLPYGSDLLQLRVEEWDDFRKVGDEPRWPAPATVGGFAEAVLKEFGQGLVLRRRGGELSPENLILSMVARILRDAIPRKKGEKVNRAQIHGLLNTHIILRSASWKSPLSDGINLDGERALWRNVSKVEKMEKLYEPGPMYIVVS